LKLLLSLNGQGKNCVCHPAHSFLFINIYFISQPRTLYSAFDKCFYICDVVVVKSLYITFLIHKKNSLRSNSMHVTNNYKIGLWGIFGRMRALLSCDVWFFSCIASSNG